MGLSRGTILAAAVALAAWPGGGQTPQQPAPAQQQVPDAPTPQTLPKLNALTPVGPALTPPPPTSASTDNAVGENGGVTPTGSLGQKPAAQAGADQGQATAPVVPAAGQGFAEANRMEESLPEPTAQTGTLNVRVQFVEVPFTVKDSKGHLVPGLTWRDVQIYESGLRQQMRLFTVDPFPLSVALLIDQSVTQDTMDKINASLAALQGAFTPYDEVSVFTYNNGFTKLTDFTAAQSARLGAVLERAKGTGREAMMPMGGPLASAGTKNNQQIDPNFNRQEQNGMQINPPKEYHTLNDAILAAAQETTKAARGRRRVVYVISDGKEYGSKASEKSVIKYLQTNQIAVYATLVGDSSIPGMGFLDRVHLPLTMRDDVLPRYAAATGGQVDPEFRPKGIENSFAHITEEVRTQYTVGYYTHASPLADGFRKIEVRVLRPGLTIIAKDGYYPSALDSRPPTPTPAATTAPPAPTAATP